MSVYSPVAPPSLPLRSPFAATADASLQLLLLKALVAPPPLVVLLVSPAWVQHLGYTGIDLSIFCLGGRFLCAWGGFSVGDVDGRHASASKILGSVPLDRTTNIVGK